MRELDIHHDGTCDACHEAPSLDRPGKAHRCSDCAVNEHLAEFWAAARDAVRALEALESLVVPPDRVAALYQTRNVLRTACGYSLTLQAPHTRRIELQLLADFFNESPAGEISSHRAAATGEETPQPPHKGDHSR